MNKEHVRNNSHPAEPPFEALEAELEEMEKDGMLRDEDWHRKMHSLSYQMISRGVEKQAETQQD